MELLPPPVTGPRRLRADIAETAVAARAAAMLTAVARIPLPRTPAGWSIDRRSSVLGRARGLLGRSSLGDVEGLWLPVRSVHTVGMRFPLDLVWIDGEGRSLRVDVEVRPGRMRTCVAASGVIEVAAGRAEALVAALARAEPVVSAARDPRRPGPPAGCASRGRRGRRTSR